MIYLSRNCHLSSLCFVCFTNVFSIFICIVLMWLRRVPVY